MIRLLLRAYPRSWRRRYGEELAQLADDTGLSPAAALDIVRGGLVERRRAFHIHMQFSGGILMVIGPAWRHPTGMALAAALVMAPTLLFVAGSIFVYQLSGTAFQAIMDDANGWLSSSRVLDLALVLAPAVALVLAIAPLVRIQLRDGDAGREAVIGVRLRLANAAVATVALAIGAILAWHVVAESVR